MFNPTQQSARLIPQPEAINLLPASIAAAHKLLPLKANSEQLICAGTGPFDLDFLSLLQFQIQRHLTLVKVPEEVFCEAFEKQYGSRIVPQAFEFLDSISKPPPKIRNEAPNNQAEWAHQPCQVTAVIGASGGVGTTTFTANLAVLLAERNYNIALLDANFSRPQAHIALGSTPAFTVRDLKRGKSSIWDTLVTTCNGIKLIAGEPGAIDCAELRYSDIAQLGITPENLGEHFDHYIIDMPGNPNESILTFLNRAHQIILITNDEPAVLHNTLALIKTITAQQPGTKISVVFNQCNKSSEAKPAFLKLKRFLGEDTIRYAGNIPISKNMESAWACRTPLAKLKHNDGAVKAIRNIQCDLYPLQLGVNASMATNQLAQTS